MKQQCNQNVGVLLPPSLTESFEICLARIVDLQKKGVPVKVISCNGTVKGCVANPIRKRAICKQCKRVRDITLSQLAPNVEHLFLDDFYDTTAISISEAEAEEINIGVRSTILTFYRRNIYSPSQGLIRNYIFSKLSERYKAHSVFVFNSIYKLLKIKPSFRIEFFNGRIVPTRAVKLAARKAQQEFCVLEVSGKNRNLTVTKNQSVHNLAFKQKELSQFIRTFSVNCTNGGNFFEARRDGEETNARSFSSRQESGLLRSPTKPIFAIFTSSADEQKVAGSQWFTAASQDPIQFILQLANLLKNQYEIVVRMHPNQAGDKTGAAKEMLATLRNSAIVEVVPPNSKLSSYELLDEAEVVLTFGSTMGLEATYWGKPSILAGRALWDNLSISYSVTTPKEVAFIINRGAKALSREHAVAVGAYYFNGTGENGSLSWRYNNGIGFFINGQSYLNLKRASWGYWYSRLALKFLKII